MTNRDLKESMAVLAVEQGRQSIYFDHDYSEPGTRYDTLCLSFRLPEFGPSWFMGHQDHGVYMITVVKQYLIVPPSGTTFSYFSKFVDTIPPVFKSLTIAPEEVYAGDTVTVTVSASDDLSGDPADLLL